MNAGLKGVPRTLRPSVEATYWIYSNQPYSVGTEPVVDTVVLGSDGNPLELRFFLQNARVVQVCVNVALAKADGGHTLRCSLYDNGTKIAPSTSLSGKWLALVGI